MSQHERYKQAKKATLIGAFINALLGFLKLIGGVFFHSHALVADGIHSFSDLITDSMVLFASKYGSQDADESHPYGHQRIETAATFFLSLLLILAGIGIAWNAINEILYGTITVPKFLTLPIALLSILANEGLFHYTRYIGNRIHSQLIIANAWHHRSDAASSMVVLIGLFGSLAGYSFFDPAAAIIVGLMVCKMGWNYGWNSIKELVDSAVEPQILAKIEHIIRSINGVKKIHQLRSRMMGQDIYIDVHILVSPLISVSEGHYIAQQVHRNLMTQIARVKDVTVHVDPEDDEISCPSFHLPNRAMLEEKLLSKWQNEFPEILSWMFHFLDGKISIDLICDPSFTNWQKLTHQIDHAILKELNIASIRLLCQQKMIRA